MNLSVQGRTAYVYTGGRVFDPAQPCVVFIHGALNDHSVWALQSRYLAHHGYGVLAVDLPGHCRSAGPALPSVEAAADWLGELLDAAGVTRAALVGHSMGSLIALEAAARLSERVSHLIMVGTAYPMKVSATLLDTALKAPLKAIDMVNTFSHSTLAAKPSAPGPGAWLHGASRALMRRVLASNPEINLFHHDFMVCDSYATGQQAAEAVAHRQCPALMVLGTKDQMTVPKAAVELGRVLHATTIALPAGHELMAETPDAVLRAIAAFLN